MKGRFPIGLLALTVFMAVDVIAKNQLNREFKAAQVKDIVTFLESLYGELAQQDAPELPPSPLRKSPLARFQCLTSFTARMMI